MSQVLMRLGSNVPSAPIFWNHVFKFINGAARVLSTYYSCPQCLLLGKVVPKATFWNHTSQVLLFLNLWVISAYLSKVPSAIISDFTCPKGSSLKSSIPSATPQSICPKCLYTSNVLSVPKAHFITVKAVNNSKKI